MKKWIELLVILMSVALGYLVVICVGEWCALVYYLGTTQ